MADKEKDKPSKPAAPPGKKLSVDPHDPALSEIYQRLYPEIRRPKPSQEAIAAALQAMQRLTIESDSELVTEEELMEEGSGTQVACRVCGHLNRIGNKFCGMCGLPSGAEVGAENSRPSVPAAMDSPVSNAPPSALPEVHAHEGTAAGKHHYHHHYHHHYFQGAQEAAVVAPRGPSPESAREADRLRVAAAAKGEPMSRHEAAVRRLTQEWILACNTKQLDELIELYAADALVLRSNLPPIRGAMAVREFFFSSLEAGLGEVALDPMRVEVLGDLAHEVGRYSALVPGTIGRREERGKYLWVFARQPGGEWKLISECWCADLTLAADESDFPKNSAAPAKAPQRKS
ncbi:MAG TPA: DUF4440 domain-containing protein [Candidatus Binatia bacterium]|nr:DUF4440 domain-containing protein [Candidatus Binatia bacterium]